MSSNSKFSIDNDVPQQDSDSFVGSEEMSKDKISLDNQLYEQRKEIFSFVKLTVLVMYGFAIGTFISLFGCPPIRREMIDHVHVMLFPVVLLVVPSTLLWGAVRAVYKTKDERMDFNPLIKSIITWLNGH